MPAFEEARKIILESISELGIEKVNLIDATGRVIAETVVAPWNLPMFDNSAMDGYAVQTESCQPGVKLAVDGYIQAGAVSHLAVIPGHAIKIMTGARIPKGCDAVVPVEETDESDEFVTINNAVVRNQHIRFNGEDIRTGDIVINRGTILHPPEIGILASFGYAVVSVHRKARVAILSTGDELMELGGSPNEGKIVNSNSYSLAAAIKEIGAVPVMLGIARDTRESHLEKITEGLKADALVTSAGVSSGDHDLVRDVLSELGVEQKFWRVDIKPGGPTAFGLRDKMPVFSLPGNPVSTMITFEEFVKPALLKMMGHQRILKRTFPVILADDIKKKPGKVNFIRVKLEMQNGRYMASLSGNQQTSYMKTMVNADGIVILPKDAVTTHAGSEVEAQLIRPELEMETFQ